MADYGELKERLRRKAQSASEIAQAMAEDKSLRQGGNTERRTDLYMWPTPEQAIEGQAADTIEALEARVKELEALVHRAQHFANLASSFDWNEDRCIMSAVHLAGDCRTALGDNPGP